MLMSAVFAQKDCNRNNWRVYYNSDGKDMSDCDLRWANLTSLTGLTLEGANFTRAIFNRATLKRAILTDANFTDANLTRATLTSAYLTGATLTRATLEGAILEGANLDGVQSGNISGLPLSLPDGWSLVDGTLGNRELSDEIFRQINEGNAIKKSKWRAWKNENDPQVSRGKTTFKNLDKNNNGKISSGEFFKFHKRWIQN